jgi:signal transduction histidine kinase
VIDLCSRSQEIIELLGRSLRGDIHVVVAFLDSVWPIECDDIELGLALMNLCVNARDAMPRVALVRIEAATSLCRPMRSALAA